MKKRVLLLFILVQAVLQVYAQDPKQEPTEEEIYSSIPDPPSGRTKLGVRAGLSFNTLSSGNLQNPRIGTGLTGGAYCRVKLGRYNAKEPKLFKYAFEPQFNFTYKGSRFANDTGEYSRISLFYLDMPLLFIINLDKKDGDYSLILGPQFSYLAKKSLFIKSDPVPVDPDSAQLKFNPFDVVLVAGLQYCTRYVNIQLLVKPGLSNINRAMDARNAPLIRPLPNGQPIRNFSVELILAF